MSILESPRASTNLKSRPLNVSLLLTIRQTDYSVAPIPPGPDNIKAYRLEKLSGARETYDLAHTNEGLVVCDCPSYVATHEGTASTCKHGSALVLMGLLPKPCRIEGAKGSDPMRPLPARSRDSWEEKAAAIEAAAGRGSTLCNTQGHPAPAFDPELYRCQNAVAEGRALWLEHRHLHAREPLLVANSPIAPPATLVSNEGAPACCPADEPTPCAACVAHEGPADLSDEAWDDDHVWSIPPEAEAEDDPEVAQLIEDGALEQAEGDAPLEFATPECFAAIAEGRAEPMREFGLVPYVAWMSRANRDEIEADDAILEGWASHRDRDFQASCRARSAALLAAEDALVAARQLANPLCQNSDEVARSLEQQVLDHARELRSQGSPLGDLLAEKAEQLAAEIRFLDASTVEQYRDRREAALDAARDAAESRRATACCP